MQTDSYDYYHNDDEKVGACCLICSEKSPGCLCFECACTKCFWYNPNNSFYGDGHGFCDLAREMKKDRIIKERRKRRGIIKNPQKQLGVQDG